MAVASSVFVKKVHLAASQFATLFRVNTGTGWVGDGKPQRVVVPKMVMIYPGDVVIRNARPLRAGLHKGGGDLAGWRSVIITPAMVGKRIAQFVNFECKYRSGRANDAQINFNKQVEKAGGIAAIIRIESDAVDLLK